MRFRNSFPRMALRQFVAFDARVAISSIKGILLFFLFNLFLINNVWAVFGSFDPTIYHSYSATQVWAYGLADKYPNLVKVVQYGESSVYHNPLFAIEITSNVKVNDTSKSDFLFTAGIHAREVISSEAAISIATDLINGYNSTDATKKSTYQSMLSQRDVWIIPQQNPDGRLQVESAGTSALSGQRKNWDWYSGQSLTGTSRGVDLNRNYPHQWSKADSRESLETYRGPAPLSESEASSLWTFIHNKDLFSNLLCSVDFHSGVQQILTPWTSSNDTSPPLPADDAAKFTSLKTALGSITDLSTAPYGPNVFGCLSDSIYDQSLQDSILNGSPRTYAMTEEIYVSGGDNLYARFNPLNATDRDIATQKAVASAYYLLHDANFTVPEPSTFVLLSISGLFLLMIIRHRRFR